MCNLKADCIASTFYWQVSFGGTLTETPARYVDRFLSSVAPSHRTLVAILGIPSISTVLACYPQQTYTFMQALKPPLRLGTS